MKDRVMDENFDAIKDLYESAQEMQSSIPELKNEDDRKLMKAQFRSVAMAINRLMDSSKDLYAVLGDLETRV